VTLHVKSLRQDKRFGPHDDFIVTVADRQMFITVHRSVKLFGNNTTA